MVERRIEVVAGVIWSPQRDAVLLSRRHPDQHQGDRWEFPGGKIEAGETPAAALQRELREELSIDVTDTQLWLQHQHDYADKQVALQFWHVNAFTGTPTGVEGQPLRWVKLAALTDYTFPAANQVVVEALLS